MFTFRVVTFVGIVAFSLSHGLTSNAQNGLTLNEVIERHESALASFESLKCKWEVKTTSNAGDESVERFESSVTPWYEETVSFQSDGGRVDELWNGKYFQRIVNNSSVFDEFPDPTVVKAVRLDEPISSSLNFRWRILQTYRFLTIDKDLTLRELCGRSNNPPSLNLVEGKYKISLSLPPPFQSGSAFCDELRTEVYLDPAHGFAICKQVSFCSKPGDILTQELVVEEFKELDIGLFFPTWISGRLFASSGGGALSQEMKFRYSDFNSPVDINDRINHFFPKNVIVREASRNEDKQARCYYVTSDEGALGEPISTEIEAIAVLSERMAGKPNSVIAYYNWIVLGVLSAIALVITTYFRKSQRKR
ncbi:MAG: hypothetical protein MUC43_12705 [Pirellula sp.]|nr:hypothetical protein [Pirellula sp.]